MSKLGLCICYQHRNYGSQLQCYATTWELRRRGVDYEIIRYAKAYTPRMILRLLPRLTNPVWISERVLQRYTKKIALALCPSFRRKNALRNEKIAAYSAKKFTALSPVFKGYDALREGSARYAAVMVGSDQLWSPSGIESGFYNLMFVADGVPRLAYAASIGVSQVDGKLHGVYRDFLTRMSCISMREQRGQALVKALSGREAAWVVDPVLLLDAAQWRQEIPDQPLYQEPYVFAYFLGRSRAHRQQVKAFAKARGLKLVTLHHMDTVHLSELGFGDEIPYNVGPEEFVNLVRHAAYVFTDSFHGAAFSILERKPFLVFERYAAGSAASKNSRIESLCESCGVHDRLYQGDVFAVEAPMDYDAVHAKLAAHRAQSLRYLDEALASVSTQRRDPL